MTSASVLEELIKCGFDVADGIPPRSPLAAHHAGLKIIAVIPLFLVTNPFNLRFTALIVSVRIVESAVSTHMKIVVTVWAAVTAENSASPRNFNLCSTFPTVHKFSS